MEDSEITNRLSATQPRGRSAIRRLMRRGSLEAQHNAVFVNQPKSENRNKAINRSKSTPRPLYHLFQSGAWERTSFPCAYSMLRNCALIAPRKKASVQGRIVRHLK